MECPHCNKNVSTADLPDIERAQRHAESYGSGFTTSECPFCHKKFTFYTEVQTVVYQPKKSADDAITSY